MAKKIRKKVSTPPLYLFIELLLPWIIMGLVAVAGAEARLPVVLIFILSIAAALVVTLLMRSFERNRRRRQVLRGQ